MIVRTEKGKKIVKNLKRDAAAVALAAGTISGGVAVPASALVSMRYIVPQSPQAVTGVVYEKPQMIAAMDANYSMPEIGFGFMSEIGFDVYMTK